MSVRVSLRVCVRNREGGSAKECVSVYVRACVRVCERLSGRVSVRVEE